MYRNSVWQSQAALPVFCGVRTIYRFVTTGLLLGLVALFGWLVFRPLYHPNARAAFMSGADYHVLRAPPATFALEDADGLKPLAKVLVSRGSDAPPALLSSLSNPAAMRTLAADLTDLTPQSDGVLIVYVIAHGISDDGTAYLLCRNFDPANPSAGRVPLADFLKQVKETPAAVKLILLDAGRIPSDPRLGMLVNEFPRLLKREVRKTGDENLWVLKRPMPRFSGRMSPGRLERSVFGFFAARGLQGAADLNGDHVVDLGELYRYVAANTAAWVRAATGGDEGNANADPPPGAGGVRSHAGRVADAAARGRRLAGQVGGPQPLIEFQGAARSRLFAVCPAGAERIRAGCQQGQSRRYQKSPRLARATKKTLRAEKKVNRPRVEQGSSIRDGKEGRQRD